MLSVDARRNAASDAVTFAGAVEGDTPPPEPLGPTDAGELAADVGRGDAHRDPAALPSSISAESGMGAIVNDRSDACSGDNDALVVEISPCGGDIGLPSSSTYL